MTTTVQVVVKKKARFNGPDLKTIGMKDIGDIIVICDGPYFESLRKDGFVEEYLDITKELDTEHLDANQIKGQRYSLPDMHIAKLRSLAATLGMLDSVKQSKDALIAYIKEHQNQNEV